jgi:hypothetical protein
MAPSEKPQKIYPVKSTFGANVSVTVWTEFENNTSRLVLHYLTGEIGFHVRERRAAYGKNGKKK